MKKVIKMVAFMLGCSTCTQAATLQMKDNSAAPAATAQNTNDADEGDALSSMQDLNKIYSL